MYMNNHYMHVCSCLPSQITYTGFMALTFNKNPTPSPYHDVAMQLIKQECLSTSGDVSTRVLQNILPAPNPLDSALQGLGEGKGGSMFSYGI